MSYVKQWGVGISMLAAVSIAGAATLAGARDASPAAGVAKQAQRAPGPYIVSFKEDPLARYRGGVSGMPAPQRRVGATGQQRLDVKSAQARNYVAYLQRRQFEHEGAIARALGRQPAVRVRMQHAINGIVVEMSPAEAQRVRALPGVRLVEAYREYSLNTDVGPELIGVEPVWSGSNPPGPAVPFQGEGMVLGILDTGINYDAPSFDEVDPVDGYTHVNPLGDGNFLGTCEAGEVDEGRCNDKLIGGYDFVCGPPANQCGQPNVTEEPGFGDNNGHGSHTASTAGGNRRDVVFRGNDVRISGVAPRANVVAFDICYTVTSTGQGLCPNVSAAAAVDQAVADGEVDVINYSIGGGTQPWSDAVSQAFLSAVDAGIYIAASAGNSGPGPNTMGHLQPWVSSTASAQHGRGNFVTVMEVTGPAPVPPALQAVIINEGASGVPHTAEIPGTTPLVVSASIDGADDACNTNPPPAGAFEDAIAVVRRGTCPFTEKVNNAAAAGAIAVVIANNAAGALIPSVPGTTIRTFGATQADGNALRDFAATSTGETASIGFPAMVQTNTVDALAASSSRGPAGTFDLLKPDITAPGVLVLAVTAGPADALALFSGTSMASPHQAGAAALVRQARPAWTMPEIKSALVMTADQTVLLEDQVTPANPFAAGGGRVRVDRAINAGLVLHETEANYLAANPATGGDESTLNQPSMANSDCEAPCVFERTFRNTQSTPQIWSPRLRGLNGSVSPRLIKVPAGGTATVRVTLDSSGLTPGVWSFGRLDLEASTLRSQPQRPTLRLPIAIAVQP